MEDQDGDSKKEVWRFATTREKYRFALAFTILVLFGLLLAAAMMGGYSDPATLAGTFSGWIAAIVGFYFMDEASERAVGQETRRIVNDELSDGEASCEEALRKKHQIIDDLKVKFIEMTSGMERQLKEKDLTIVNLKEGAKKLTDVCDDYAELVSTLETQLKEKKKEAAPR